MNKNLYNSIKEIYSANKTFSMKDSEELFKIIKQYFDDKELLYAGIINFLYDKNESIISNTISKGKALYKTWDNKKPINATELLYQGDGKTLEERTAHWVQSCTDPLELLYRINIILLNNSYQITPQVIKQKIKIKFVDIVGEGDCDNHCPTGHYRAQDAPPDPPYHVNCRCMAVYDETDDPKEWDEE